LDSIRFAVFDSSLGHIVLVSKKGRLIELDIRADDPHKIRKSLIAHYSDGVESPESFNKVFNLLDKYLKGKRVTFDVDVDLSDVGAFTQKVLEELRKVPYGDMVSYSGLGKRVGYKNAGRAVGQAVGRNPIPIIIPCHRVIREDGTIGGFSSGIEIKKKLLAVEGVLGKIKKQSI
jgi:O-6-methylguanine DNA methyltransferase